MSGYGEIIMNATGCAADEVELIEDVMRDVVFHSTLDWQTREQLEEGARIARAALEQSSRYRE